MKQLGTTALVIGSGGIGSGIVRSLALPFPVVVDHERSAYAAYGLFRSAFIIQESGTFLIDREGVVRHATRALNPRASMDWAALVAEVRRLNASTRGAE